MESGLWKATKQDHLNLHEEHPSISPEMISTPSIGVFRMYNYINHRFKEDDHIDVGGRDKVDSELL